MMTVQDVASMLQLLESNYGQRFYDGVNKEYVLKTWSAMFRDDDPALVMQGVKNCINTMPYKPTIADIRKRMSQARMQGQMTEIQAFQAIQQAVEKSYGREDAVKQFAALPPILQELVCTPSQLRSWRLVNEDTFQSVVMSVIARSYRELAQREADFHALPKDLQQAEGWMLPKGTPAEALPQPVKEKTLDEMEAEQERKSEAFRERFGITPNPEYADRVAAFVSPMTDEDRKRMDETERAKEVLQKSKWSMK